MDIHKSFCVLFDRTETKLEPKQNHCLRVYCCLPAANKIEWIKTF